MAEGKTKHTKSDKLKGFVQLICVVLFIVGSFAASNALKTNKKMPQVKEGESKKVLVESQVFSPKTYQVSFDVTGLVEAEAELQITPEVSGRVVRVNPSARSGARFKAGEPLFQVDTKDYELALSQRRSELAQAKTAYALEEAESEAAIKEWKLLHGSTDVPALVSRAPQLAEAKARLEAAQRAFDNAQQDLVKTSFLFPFDGVVVDSRIVEGQYVSAGQSYGTAYNKGALQARVSLDREKLNWLMSSERADAKIEVEHLGQIYQVEGTLRAGDIFTESATRFTPVYFNLPADQAYLFAGQLARVYLKGPVTDDVLRLPVLALQADGQVWIYDEGGTVHGIKPDIIYRDRTHVAIAGIDKPLNVITSRLPGATEGMRVEHAHAAGKD